MKTPKYERSPWFDGAADACGGEDGEKRAHT